MKLVDVVVPVMTTTFPVAAVRSTAVAEAISAPAACVCSAVKVLAPRMAAVPTTPAGGSPVALVKTPDAGVPNAGVTRVGDVANTADPEPVSLVKAVASCAEVNEPNTAALPVEVIWPVRFALVVTVPAVKLAAVPVRLVATPDAGVPKAGVVNIGEVRVLLVSVSVPVLVTRLVGVMMSDKLAIF